MLMPKLKKAPDLSFLTLDRYEADLMKEITINGGRGVIASDWHIPIVSEEWVRHLIHHARKNKATDWLLVPGDWFNFDVLSQYDPKQSDHTLVDELAISSRLMRILLGIFDEVIVCLGNHDVRFQRALGFKIRFEQSMRMCFGTLPESMLAKMRFTNLDYALVETPEGTWRGCHTNQYSKTQLVVPASIADMECQHVAAAHRHHCAFGYSPSGRWAVELGGMMNADKTMYLKRWSSNHPKWRNGYLILLDGIPLMPCFQKPVS